jgi:hypothetical protein
MLLLVSGCQESKPEATSAQPASLPSADKLREMIDAEVTYTLQKRDLNGEVNAAWQILHGVLGYGRNFEIVLGPERVKAIDWALGGGNMKGWTMRKIEGQPGVTAVVEVGSKTGQGHPDQWLAIMAQCNVGSDETLMVDGQKYAVKDLVTQAMYDIYEGKEASWTAISLAQYIDMNAEWPSKDGSIWTIERIVAMEAAADFKGAACGGTHRLSALTFVLNRYQEANKNVPLARGWLAAKERTEEAIALVKEYQLPSGALSTDFFVSSLDTTETSKHLYATGHTLEFLALTMDPEELRDPWVVRAVVFLTNLLRRTRNVPNLECGALYHAARGLRVYRERVYGPHDYFLPLEPVSSTAAAPPSDSAAKQPEVAAAK